MKIVVLDGYTENPGDLSWEPLNKLGDLVVYDRTPGILAAERIADAEVVFTNKTEITKEILEKCKALKYIGVLATGYNVVDVEAARDLGITVTNIPSYGTAAVAQYTMALLLELCHHAGEHSDCVKRGEWSANQDWCFWKYPLWELDAKTIGIVGYGRIGQAVGRLAQAFGMGVVFYDEAVFSRDQQTQYCRQVSWEELLSSSDVISLHCPLTEKNKGLINKDSIGRMKPGVFILNDARGPLIVEQDLAAALEKGTVAGAALDVVSVEPIRTDNPLLKAPNIIITPHIAWAPKESRQRLMNIAVSNLEAFQKGNPVNVVNN